MLKIGLTGGIGSGKSTVARMFGVLGVPVFEADAVARMLMNTDPRVREAITSRFGASIYRKGDLDRAALAATVFTDPIALADLNAIVHPAVRRAFAEWVTEQTAPYVIMEAALMVENDGYKQFDRVITVACAEDERIHRVMERDGVGEEEVLARMRNQASEADRLRLAHHVIHNDGSQLVIPQVLGIHQELLTLAEQ